MIPLQITFRDIDHSEAVESLIRGHAAQLERFCARITRCHAIVDAPQHQRHSDDHEYAIRLVIKTVSGEIVVTRDPSLGDLHADFQAVLRDAFEAATRHLESEAKSRQGLRAASVNLPP